MVENMSKNDEDEQSPIQKWKAREVTSRIRPREVSEPSIPYQPRKSSSRLSDIVHKIPSRKRLSRAFFGSPAERQKRREERIAKKEKRQAQIKATREKMDIVRATEFERGQLAGVKKRAYASGYAKGMGKSGGSSLSSVMGDLNRGATNLGDMFVGMGSSPSGNIPLVGFPERPSRPKVRHPSHPKRSHKHHARSKTHRKRQGQYDPFEMIL